MQQCFQGWIISNLVLASIATANPYPDPSLVPKDPAVASSKSSALPGVKVDAITLRREGIEVLRIDVNWIRETDSYELAEVSRELSGSAAILLRAPHPDPHGSYRGKLTTEDSVYHDSLGTGKEFRRLSRGLTFRFPFKQGVFTFTLTAENPITGSMDAVLTSIIDTADAKHRLPPAVAVRRLREAAISPTGVLNIYADGYLERRQTQFWRDAERTVSALEKQHFPRLAHLEVNAVFAPSNKQIGQAQDLGDEVVPRDSFLGLYFPYWVNFERWYHVVYPTDYRKFRDGLGSVPYDYAIILLDSADYWGVGNFKELTAVPARDPSFTFLLMHELGHYFGLNEEYDGGGRTELEFAPEIDEPWSQNITFQNTPEAIKWSEFILTATPVPTPSKEWQDSNNGPWGAYEGGYGDSYAKTTVHKPGLACVMDRARDFCPVCTKAIFDRIGHDLGIAPLPQ